MLHNTVNRRCQKLQFGPLLGLDQILRQACRLAFRLHELTEASPAIFGDRLRAGLEGRGNGSAGFAVFAPLNDKILLLLDQLLHRIEILQFRANFLAVECLADFETLLDDQDAVISDALNHASIIDGIRLCKARRLRYSNNDLNELEQCLKDSQDARVRLIATDGVFSMDGSIARLSEICDLADRYSALVMVDDSHATGFMGPRGRGTHEMRGVIDRVHILTGTLGKALGGASGGYVAARREIVAWLRQRSRPYLFSNSIPPAVAAGTIRVLDLLEHSPELRERVHSNARHFRAGMQALGFELVPGEHPIIPVMLGDAPLAVRLAERMQSEGVYVVAFAYPVVPKGKARIRTQMNAAHSTEQLDHVVGAFGRAARELGMIH